MKHFCSILFLLILFSISGSGQTTIVKTSVINPFFRSYTLAAEFKIKDYRSTQLTATYSYFPGDTSSSILQITPEYRYYLKTPMPKGVFLAPFFNYLNGKGEKITGETARWNAYRLGLAIGGQFLFAEKISLEIFGGPAFGLYNISRSGTIEAATKQGNYSGLGVRLGINVGFAF